MSKRSLLWSNVATGLGVATILAACWMLFGPVEALVWPWVLLLLGLTATFIGFCFYINAKGYHYGWAFLFFLIGPFVLLVFFFMPDRSRPAAK
jgi:hypothetical protein